MRFLLAMKSGSVVAKTEREYDYLLGTMGSLINSTKRRLMF